VRDYDAFLEDEHCSDFKREAVPCRFMLPARVKAWAKKCNLLHRAKKTQKQLCRELSARTGAKPFTKSCAAKRIVDLVKTRVAHRVSFPEQYNAKGLRFAAKYYKLKIPARATKQWYLDQLANLKLQETEVKVVAQHTEQEIKASGEEKKHEIKEASQQQIQEIKHQAEAAGIPPSAPEVKAEIKQVEQEAKAEIKQVEQEVKQEVQQVKEQAQAQQDEIKGYRKRLEEAFKAQQQAILKPEPSAPSIVETFAGGPVIPSSYGPTVLPTVLEESEIPEAPTAPTARGSALVAWLPKQLIPDRMVTDKLPGTLYGTYDMTREYGEKFFVFGDRAASREVQKALDNEKKAVRDIFADAEQVALGRSTDATFNLASLFGTLQNMGLGMKVFPSADFAPYVYAKVMLMMKPVFVNDDGLSPRGSKGFSVSEILRKMSLDKFKNVETRAPDEPGLKFIGEYPESSGKGTFHSPVYPQFVLTGWSRKQLGKPEVEGQPLLRQKEVYQIQAYR